AIPGDADAEPSILLIGEGRAECRGRDVTDPGGAVRADVLIVLVGGPEGLRHIALEPGRGEEGPVLRLDLLVDLHADPGCGDRAVVPAVRRCLLRRLHGLAMCLPECLAASLERSASTGGHLLPDFLDEHWQGRFRVRGHGKVYARRQTLQILIIALRGELDGRNRDL